MSEFFNAKEVEAFTISELPILAKKQAVKINSMQFQPVQAQGKGMKRHALAISCSASFEQLMTFFYELEQYSKTIKLSNVSVRRVSLNPVIVRAELTLELFSVMGQP